MREESHLDDMRSAIRGDFERLAERLGSQELMRADPATDDEPESEPGPDPDPGAELSDTEPAETSLQQSVASSDPELDAEPDPGAEPDSEPADASLQQSVASDVTEPEPAPDVGPDSETEADPEAGPEPRRRSLLDRLLGR